ncbi:MAG: glycosyltransferase family 4 protein [Bacteroidetes bacterium]|nr:glycosyltransferase family 4 protein [Bacteroidota bacterium]MBU1374022.1 glycosyltransferase family 4 protein [Bacteroidota bacterium]MBU1484638.1 glycosyltransferase family 4 protein [Bacteroidota bacterium]MBU1760602.1 glycosyltransferase family 4 protein [Bacteroidota bacterium]MBU2269084.1 glycosyltransferase family 4 protein [Bacteroidota bacterium]
MRIGFEAKRAFKNFTGLGNYARSVIKILSTQHPENQYFLYTPDKVKTNRTKFLYELPNTIIRSAPLKFLKSYWRSKGVVKDLIKDEIELYHGLSHELPSGLKKAGINSIVTIHDLIYLRYPQYFKWLDRKIYDAKFRLACKSADKIIAISEQTKRDIIHFFGTNESKIEVVYQGCDPVFYKAENQLKLGELKSKYQLPDEFLLCVGTIENRKNQLLILKALQNLPDSINLILVGKKTPYQDILQNFITLHNFEKRVTFLNDVPFLDLPGIYQLAKIFIYPSKFEGFGIPILEALNCGVPVIASKGSCLEEAGGPDSYYVANDDAEALRETILKVFGNDELRKQMSEKGKRFALSFREDKVGANLIKVYQEIINHA